MPDGATLSSKVRPALGQFDSYVQNPNRYWEGVLGVQCVAMLLESQRNAELPWEWKSRIIMAIHHIYYGVIGHSSSTSCLLVSKSLIFYSLLGNSASRERNPFSLWAFIKRIYNHKDSVKSKA